MVAHHEIAVLGHAHGTKIAEILVHRRYVGFRNYLVVDVNDTAADFHGFARQPNHALDEGLGAVERIPKDHNVASLYGLKAVNEFINEDAFLVRKQRRHARTFDLHRLVQEDDDDQSEADGNEEIAGPDTHFVTNRMR